MKNVIHIEEILESGQKNIPKIYNGLPSDLQKAFDCIRANIYNEELDVQWLKRQCDIKDKNFSARFKIHLGYYPKEFILYHRINISKDLLKQTEQTITTIAIVIGFKSLSSFCKTFKRKVRLSPSEWRNNSVNTE